MPKRSFNPGHGLEKGDGKIKLAGAKGSAKVSYRGQEGVKHTPAKKSSKPKPKKK